MNPRNRLMDAEDRLVVARREVAGGGMEWVVGVRRYKINNRVLLYSSTSRLYIVTLLI